MAAGSDIVRTIKFPYDRIRYRYRIDPNSGDPIHFDGDIYTQQQRAKLERELTEERVEGETSVYYRESWADGIHYFRVIIDPPTDLTA